MQTVGCFSIQIIVIENQRSDLMINKGKFIVFHISFHVASLSMLHYAFSDDLIINMFSYSINNEIYYFIIISRWSLCGLCHFCRTNLNETRLENR